MADVIAGGSVVLTLRDERGSPDWKGVVAVGVPGVETRVRARADWADGVWTATVVVPGPSGSLRSQWILTRGDVPVVVEGEAVTVEPGMPNVGLTGDADDPSWARRALAAAREALAAAAGSTDLSITVDGYSASFETRADLLAFEAELARRVERKAWRKNVRLVPC